MTRRCRWRYGDMPAARAPEGTGAGGRRRQGGALICEGCALTGLQPAGVCLPVQGMCPEAGPDLLNAEQPPRQGLSWGLLCCVRRYGPGRISIRSGPGFEHPEIRLPEPGPGYGLEQFQFVRELHGILALDPVGDSAFMPGKAVAKGQ